VKRRAGGNEYGRMVRGPEFSRRNNKKKKKEYNIYILWKLKEEARRSDSLNYRTEFGRANIKNPCRERVRMTMEIFGGGNHARGGNVKSCERTKKRSKPGKKMKKCGCRDEGGKRRKVGGD